MLFTLCLSHVRSHKLESTVCLHYVKCIHTNIWAHPLWSKSLVLMVSVCIIPRCAHEQIVLLIKFFHCALQCYFTSKTIWGFWFTLFNQYVKWQVAVEEQCIIPPALFCYETCTFSYGKWRNLLLEILFQFHMRQAM
jgi:hypothetical protein